MRKEKTGIKQEQTDRQKSGRKGFAAFLALCPVRHALVLLSGLVILVHLLERKNHTLMVFLSERFVRPAHRAMSQFFAHLPFSMAELLIAAGVIGAAVYLIFQIIQLIRKKERLKRLYRTLMTAAAAGLTIYALFCVLWGVYYYADDFSVKSGFRNGPVSVEELTAVTRYFADMVNEYADQVPRSADGVCISDTKEVLAKSPEVFRITEQRYPALEGPEIAAKGIFFSRIMSYTDFTGFFFPFTAEANVNTDQPACDFAATVAHELSHQRGVAKEQEANFTAVVASLDYGDPDYVYSAALLAYIHLSNALYKADKDAYMEIRRTFTEEVERDFAYRSAYWKQFETPVQKVSNTVYEGFLHSYDQTMGLRSYGACVDYLVHYYYEEAAAHIEQP